LVSTTISPASSVKPLKVYELLGEVLPLLYLLSINPSRSMVVAEVFIISTYFGLPPVPGPSTTSVIISFWAVRLKSIVLFFIKFRLLINKKPAVY